MNKAALKLLTVVGFFLAFSGTSSAYDQVLTSVRVNPATLSQLTTKSVSHLSALGFDQNGPPIFSGVTYEWGISSDASIAQVFPDSNGRKIALLRVVGAGEGELFVIARQNAVQVSTSMHLLTHDNVTVCAADINIDGEVNLKDYTVLANFFLKSGSAIGVPRADIDANGIVDLKDYSTLVRAFFVKCVK